MFLYKFIINNNETQNRFYFTQTKKRNFWIQKYKILGLCI